MNEVIMSSEEIRPEFQYLNMVRNHGSINMFGAAPYLAEEFGLDQHEAKRVLFEWMRWVEKERK